VSPKTVNAGTSLLSRSDRFMHRCPFRKGYRWAVGTRSSGTGNVRIVPVKSRIGTTEGA